LQTVHWLELLFDLPLAMTSEDVPAKAAVCGGFLQHPNFDSWRDCATDHYFFAEPVHKMPKLFSGISVL